MPNHNDFYVADSLPRVKNKSGFANRSPDEIAMVPSVTRKDDSIQVTRKLGDIPAGESIDVFESPLRVCVGNDLEGS
jgi:hypothetical protein